MLFVDHVRYVLSAGCSKKCYQCVLATFSIQQSSNSGTISQGTINLFHSDSLNSRSNLYHQQILKLKLRRKKNLQFCQNLQDTLYTCQQKKYFNTAPLQKKHSRKIQRASKLPSVTYIHFLTFQALWDLFEKPQSGRVQCKHLNRSKTSLYKHFTGMHSTHVKGKTFSIPNFQRLHLHPSPPSPPPSLFLSKFLLQISQREF